MIPPPSPRQQMQYMQQVQYMQQIEQMQQMQQMQQGAAGVPPVLPGAPPDEWPPPAAAEMPRVERVQTGIGKAAPVSEAEVPQPSHGGAR